MKKVLVSILGGILVPILLIILAATITWLLPQYNLDVIYINGVPAPGLIFAPVVIPIYLYIYFQPSISYPIFFTPWFRLFSFVFFNFVFYFILTFLFMSFLRLFKSKTHDEENMPPPSPEIYKETL